MEERGGKGPPRVAWPPWKDPWKGRSALCPHSALCHQGPWRPCYSPAERGRWEGGSHDCSPSLRRCFLSPAGTMCFELLSPLRREETLLRSSPTSLLSQKPPSATDVSLQLGAWPRSPGVLLCLQPPGWAPSIAQWVTLPWPSGTIQVPGRTSPLRHFGREPAVGLTRIGV